MSVFITLISKDNNSIERVISKAEDAITNCFPIKNPLKERYVWLSASRKFASIIFYNNMPKIVANKNDEFTLFTGNVSNEIVKRSSIKSDIKQVVRNASGVFSSIKINDREGSCYAFVQQTRIESIFYSELDDYIAISNRALPLSILRDSKPRYDIKAFSSFIEQGFFGFDFVPFKGVDILAGAHEIEVKKGVLSVSGYHEVGPSFKKPTSQDFDEISESLVSSIKLFKEYNKKNIVHITGGKDSRMVFAAATAANLEFETLTSGQTDSKDMIIGEAISKASKKVHNKRYLSPEDSLKNTKYLSIDDRINKTLISSDGMISAYENCQFTLPKKNAPLSFGGHGGEILRGGFSFPDIKKPNDERIRNRIFSMFSSSRNFLNKEAYNSYMENFELYVKSKLNNKLTYADIASDLHIINRVGRWSAASRSSATLSEIKSQILFDGKLFDSVYPIDINLKKTDLIIYEIIKRLNPKLLDFPLAKGGWVLPDRQHNDYIDLYFPKTFSSAVSTSGYNWRAQIAKDLNNYLEKNLLDNDEGSEIYEICNRSYIERVIKDKSINAKDNRILWNVLTAKKLISNKWLTESVDGNKAALEINSVKFKDTGRRYYLTDLSQFSSLNKDLSSPIEIDSSELFAKTSKIKVSNDEFCSRLSSQPTERNAYFATFQGGMNTSPKENISKLCMVKGKLNISLIVENKFHDDLKVYLILFNDNKIVYKKHALATFNSTTYSSTFDVPDFNGNYRICFQLNSNVHECNKILKVIISR